VKWAKLSLLTSSFFVTLRAKNYYNWINILQSFQKIKVAWFFERRCVIRVQKLTRVLRKVLSETHICQCSMYDKLCGLGPLIHSSVTRQ